MPATARVFALSVVAVAVCCCALLFATSIPIELLEAPAHTVPAAHNVPAGKVNSSRCPSVSLSLLLRLASIDTSMLLQVVHPAVAAALHAAHTQHSSAVHQPAAKEVAAHAAHPTSAATQHHKLKVEAELENAEHMRAMASAAAAKVTPRANETKLSYSRTSICRPRSPSPRYSSLH